MRDLRSLTYRIFVGDERAMFINACIDHSVPRLKNTPLHYCSDLFACQDKKGSLFYSYFVCQTEATSFILLVSIAMVGAMCAKKEGKRYPFVYELLMGWIVHPIQAKKTSTPQYNLQTPRILRLHTWCLRLQDISEGYSSAQGRLTSRKPRSLFEDIVMPCDYVIVAPFIFLVFLLTFIPFFGLDLEPDIDLPSFCLSLNFVTSCL